MDFDKSIEEKSKQFALRIIRLNKYLKEEKNEHIISEKVLNSGTSIGTNVIKGVLGYGVLDFYYLFNDALKYAEETLYWLELLYKSGYIEKKHYESIFSDGKEIVRILRIITKKGK